MTDEYIGTPRIVYGPDGGTFIRVCPKCGRFVKADETIGFSGQGQPVERPNATCKKCGRVKMVFEGYYE